MTIEKTVSGNAAELALTGWLDTQSAPELEAALSSLGGDVQSLSLNCAGLEYISSAGLRQIVAAHKKMKGELTLKNVSQEVMEVFRMTGFYKKLRIE